MNQQDVITFFNRCAPTWDAEMVRDDEIIAAILDNGGIRPGIDVLDVACGTGVLFPDYLARNVASLTAVDISPEMVKIAREKFPQVTVRCGDVENMEFDMQFDAIMIYNAFPHFPEPARLLERLSGLLRSGGRLSVAHGMSRQKLDRHHSGRAGGVSLRLPEAWELAALLAPYCAVDVAISNERMYQVSGVLRASK